MLKDEWEVKMYLMERIWGMIGCWEDRGFTCLQTVTLIKLALTLGCKI
jgi:hypothetical protein